MSLPYSKLYYSSLSYSRLLHRRRSFRQSSYSRLSYRRLHSEHCSGGLLYRYRGRVVDTRAKLVLTKLYSHKFKLRNSHRSRPRYTNFQTHSEVYPVLNTYVW